MNSKAIMAALILAPLLMGMGKVPASETMTVPFDAAIVIATEVGPQVVLLQYGDQIVVGTELPAVSDQADVFKASWMCGGMKIEVIVPKKDGEDTGNWKRRFKQAVDAAKELFPPNPTPPI